MNTPITFEIAKALKEKGFDDVDCGGYYDVCDGYKLGYAFCYSDVHKQSENAILAPTIAEVVMWLYEKYGIYIWISQEYSNDFSYSFRDKNGLTPPTGVFKSPTEAYLSAITHTLNNIL